jgi:hypothetical protein
MIADDGWQMVDGKQWMVGDVVGDGVGERNFLPFVYRLLL